MCSVPKVNMNKKFILDLSENENNRKYDNELLLTFKIKKNNFNSRTGTGMHGAAASSKTVYLRWSHCDYGMDRIKENRPYDS